MLKQYSTLGYSVYPSTWIENRKQLSSLFLEGSAVFTSLHISEEMDEGYVTRVEEMMDFLKETGYKVIADVSKRSLDVFHEKDLLSLSERLKIDVLRIDYGFSEEEMLRTAKHVPICLNASTITEDFAKMLKETGGRFYAMHNFYPRPETGLDIEQFIKRNEMLRSYGIDVMAFIPGNSTLRGPIFEGLPTLEKHRGVMPYLSFTDMQNRFKISNIFVGDGVLTSQEAEDIRVLIEENIYQIRANLREENAELYDSVFTVRIDSPKEIIRIQESREYATKGETIKPRNTHARPRGTITMDNERYRRYSGEVQILRTDFGEDERVNIIGEVSEEYLDVLDLMPNGSRIRLIRQ